LQKTIRRAALVVKGLKNMLTRSMPLQRTEALEQAEINSYDLIILTLCFPGLSGFEVSAACARLALKFPFSCLPRGMLSKTACSLDHGADDYLTKPFEFLELLARMRALLRRPVELKLSHYP